MRGQRLELEWILSCERSFTLKWGCTKDLCCHLFFFQLWQMLSPNLPEGVLSELMNPDHLFLMSKMFEGLRDEFLKLKDAL